MKKGKCKFLKVGKAMICLCAISLIVTNPVKCYALENEMSKEIIMPTITNPMVDPGIPPSSIPEPIEIPMPEDMELPEDTRQQEEVIQQEAEPTPEPVAIPVTSAVTEPVSAPQTEQETSYKTVEKITPVLQTKAVTDETVIMQDTKAEEYEKVKEKLAASKHRVSEKDIPGIFSSVMKQNAEKNAVPMTLNLVNKQTEKVYGNSSMPQENLVNNITITQEKTDTGRSFAQVSKGVVTTGILLCIGMASVLGIFFVKK